MPASSGVAEGSSTTGSAPEPTTADGSSSGPEGGRSSSSSSSGGGGSESESTGEDAPVEPVDCDARCSNVLEDGCVAMECVETCAEAVDDQGASVADAFEACVSTEFLCFSGLADCMWSELFPDRAVEQTVWVQRQGLEAWEGRTMYGVLTIDAETADADPVVIEGGNATVQAALAIPFQRLGNFRVMRWFIDVDGDGQCTNAADLTGTEIISVDFEFDTPSFGVVDDGSVAPQTGGCPPA